ncbi:MAG: phage holin family protein [Alistipes sp.]|nr:phage holin family protein [Alistipes sp.]
MTLHLNISQDIGHGLTIIFICCVFIIAAVLMDLDTGVRAARKSGEKISSRNLRRTITKIIDYLRVLVFGVMIDVLGLAFPWYNIPYCAILVALAVVLIEGKSVLENYRKTKSTASKLPEEIAAIIKATTQAEAEKILDFIKDNKTDKQ